MKTYTKDSLIAELKKIRKASKLERIIWGVDEKP